MKRHAEKLTQKSSETSGKGNPWLPWTRSERTGRFLVRWRVLTGYLVLLLALGWGAVGTGLYFFIKTQSGYTEVRYGHILGLPWTLKAYRKAKGEFWLSTGLQQAKEGQWRDAFDSLRSGLSDAPENEEARLMLARIYIGVGRPDMARPVLLEGLAYRTDKGDYLRNVIGFLFAQQADEAVVELTKGLLQQGGLPPATRRMVEVARIYAHFNRDQFTEARAAAAESGLSDSPEGRFIDARTAWEKGQRESALILMRELHRQAPQDAEIYRTLVLYLQDSGALGDARRVVLARQFAHPENPDSFVDYIVLCGLEGDKPRQQEAEREFLKRFGADPDALMKLAVVSAKAGKAGLVWELAGHLPPKSDKLFPMNLLGIEAEIRKPDYEAAKRKIAEIRAAGAGLNSLQLMALSGLEGVAQLGAGQKPDSQSTFGRLLSTSQIPSASLTSFAEQVDALADSITAARLLRRALELDPLNRAALVALLRLELKGPGLEAALPFAERLPSMRKPPEDLMLELISNLESDRYLFLKERSPVIDRLRARLKTIGHFSTTPAPKS